MDHAINSVRTYYEISLEELYREWTSGEYKTLSECPSFEECSTYRKAIKVMNDWLYGKKSKGSVKEDLEGHMWVINAEVKRSVKQWNMMKKKTEKE